MDVTIWGPVINWRESSVTITVKPQAKRTKLNGIKTCFLCVYLQSYIPKNIGWICNAPLCFFSSTIFSSFHVSHVHPSLTIWFDAWGFWEFGVPGKCSKVELAGLILCKTWNLSEDIFIMGQIKKCVKLKEEINISGLELNWNYSAHDRQEEICRVLNWIFPKSAVNANCWMSMKQHWGASDKLEPSGRLNFQPFILKLFFSFKLTVRLSLDPKPHKQPLMSKMWRSALCEHRGYCILSWGRHDCRWQIKWQSIS